MRFAPFFALPLALAVACTPLDPATDTALSIGGGGIPAPAGTGGSDGVGGTTVLPPAWACLREPTALVDQPPQMVQYVVAIVDFDSQPPPNMPTAVKNLNIVVCGSPSCDPPAKAPDVVVINPVPGLPEYVYAIQFPYNFSNGYLRLTAPNYAPMDYVFGGPMRGPPEGGYVVRGATIPLLKVATRDTIYNDLGLPGPADPTRGVLAIRTLNCTRNAMGIQGTRAAGVSLRAVPSAPPPPAVAWTLSFSNRATPNKLETDMRGVAGFVNVIPGTLDVMGIAPVGNGLPYSTVTLPVRAGVITLAEIRDGLDRWGQ